MKYFRSEGHMRRLIASPKFDTAFTAVSGLFGYGLAVVTGPLLAYALGAEGRGDYAAATVPPQVLGYALLFGFPQAAIYFSHQRSHRELVMSAWAWAAVIGGSLTLVAWWFVPNYLSDHASLTVQWFRAFLVVGVIFMPAQTAIELQRARPRLVVFNVLQIFPFVANAAVVIVLAIAGGLDLTSALAAQFGAYVAWYLIVFSVTRGWPGTDFSRETFRIQANYGYRVGFGSLAGVLTSRLDQFLLVAYVSSEELGRYAVAVTAAGVSGPVANSIALALFPKIRHGLDPTAGRHALRRSLRLTFALSASVACIVGASAPWVLPLLFSDDFRGAIVLLWLLLPGQIAFDMGSVITQKLLADGRPGGVSRALICALGTTVIGLAAFVDRYGIKSAAIITTVSGFVFLAYSWLEATTLSDRTARRNGSDDSTTSPDAPPATTTDALP